MADFVASEVVDGDTFKVKNGWKWNEKKGDTVRPTGYDTPEKGKPGYEQAKQKLENLILGKTVE
jgi:endonuclease YncB( thermonuclease family)